MTDAAPTLPEIRERIDALDRMIVALDGRSGRAQEAEGGSPEVVEPTYRALIAAFIDLELRTSGVEGGERP